MTKDGAIEAAKYLIKRLRKPQYIYRIGNQWLISGNDQQTTQLSYEVRIRDFQEVKND